MAKNINYYGLLMIGILLFSLQVPGLVVEKATLDEITNESSVILYGKIIEKESMWEGRQINTYLTIEVYKYLKGELTSNTVKVKQMGGRVGPYADEVNGSPEFSVGEEILFFLVDFKDNLWIHSIAIGGYRVIATGGQTFAVNQFNNIKFVENKGSSVTKKGEDLKPEYELKDLFSKVSTITKAE